MLSKLYIRDRTYCRCWLNLTGTIVNKLYNQIIVAEYYTEDHENFIRRYAYYYVIIRFHDRKIPANRTSYSLLYSRRLIWIFVSRCRKCAKPNINRAVHSVQKLHWTLLLNYTKNCNLYKNFLNFLSIRIVLRIDLK